MSSDSRSRASTSKQRGAAMSSRLIPPKPGAIISTARTISSVSWRGQADRPGVDAGEALEQRGLALHHRQGRARADVAEPEHRRPVGHDRDGVALDGQPAARPRGCSASARLTRPTPGRVGHRQVVAGAQRHLGRHLDLAADVQQERAVGDLVHGRRPRSPRPASTISSACSESVRRAGDVDDEPVVARLGDVQRGHDAAGLRDRGGDAADHAGSTSVCSRIVIEYDEAVALIFGVPGRARAERVVGWVFMEPT